MGGNLFLPSPSVVVRKRFEGHRRPLDPGFDGADGSKNLADLILGSFCLRWAVSHFNKDVTDTCSRHAVFSKER